MKTGVLVGAAMAAALAAAGGAHAKVFVDYLKVHVPGGPDVTFISSDDITSPESFVGTIGMPKDGFIPGTVILTEPGSGAYSDALSLLPNSAGGVDIFFFSDPATAPAGEIGTILATIAETGKVQNVSDFFGFDHGATVRVGSDIDLPIPEPATWALMLIGVAGLGSTLRRRVALQRAAI